jgi:hypothetical protein
MSALPDGLINTALSCDGGARVVKRRTHFAPTSGKRLGRVDADYW